MQIPCSSPTLLKHPASANARAFAKYGWVAYPHDSHNPGGLPFRALCKRVRLRFSFLCSGRSSDRSCSGGFTPPPALLVVLPSVPLADFWVLSPTTTVRPSGTAILGCVLAAPSASGLTISLPVFIRTLQPSAGGAAKLSPARKRGVPIPAQRSAVGATLYHFT